MKKREEEGLLLTAKQTATHTAALVAFLDKKIHAILTPAQ